MGALVKFLICHSFLLNLDEELADLSLPLASLHIRISCFKKLAKKFFVVPGLCLSDASLIIDIADNCNTLGLILLPARRSISALFDLLCKSRDTLCYSV